MRLGTAIECLVDNYKYASDKEWINDKVAWALYHTWKEADRKTENSSEKPNNCEKTDCDTCRYAGECDWEPWQECPYEPKDEPTISKMEQVEDEPMKTTDYCDICKRDMCENCVADATNPYCVPSHYEINYEPKDEPQTCDDCIWNVCNYNKAFKDEPQTERSE